jgi:hypothetical protein
VGSGEQLGDRGRCVWERLRIDQTRIARPDNLDLGGSAAGFDELNCDSIMVDLARGERGGGMLGKGGAPFRLDPGERSQREPGSLMGEAVPVPSHDV